MGKSKVWSPACLAESSATVTVAGAPADVGGVLFVGTHGSAQAPSTDATVRWSGDLGAPRPAGNAYVLLRSLNPRAATFAVVPGTAGLVLPTWRDQTPQTPLTSLPACHYYVVLAEDACGARSGG